MFETGNFFVSVHKLNGVFDLSKVAIRRAVVSELQNAVGIAAGNVLTVAFERHGERSFVIAVRAGDDFFAHGQSELAVLKNNGVFAVIRVAVILAVDFADRRIVVFATNDTKSHCNYRYEAQQAD